MTVLWKIWNPLGRACIAALLVQVAAVSAQDAELSLPVEPEGHEERVQPGTASGEELGEQEEEEGAVEPQVAPNVNLSEVAPLPEPILDDPKPATETADEELLIEELSPLETASESEASVPEESSQSDDQEEVVSTSDTEVAPEDEAQTQASAKPEESSEEQLEEHFVILGAEVKPATSTRLAWFPGSNISGLALPTPVLVINGKDPGPTLCLSSAVHGDELNGIEIVRRVMYDIDPARLRGKIIGVPIVNLQGFQSGTRYLPDRRDLNRFFPGDVDGSLASRIAYSLFSEVIAHCDFLIDLHTGSLGRTNLPQIRADMNDTEVARFTEGFDKMVVVHSPGTPGMLRTAAADAGIVSVTMEVGESMRIQENDIRAGVNSIYSLMEKQEMFSRRFVWGKPAPVYYTSFWLRTESGGLLFSAADLGDTVYAGQVLGTVTDPITNEASEIVAPVRGRIIGMAVDQVVMPGFAAYHIGKVATEDTIVDPELPVDEVLSGEVGLDDEDDDLE